MSGISITDDRAPHHFRRARDQLEDIYAELIRKLLPRNRKMQLFVVLMLDQSLPNGSTLVEGEAVWVQGEASEE